MKKNVCGVERTIRILLGITLPILYFAKVAQGAWGIVTLVIGLILLITGFVKFCPLNSLLGINTCKK